MYGEMYCYGNIQKPRSKWSQIAERKHGDETVHNNDTILCDKN